jgi:hypothetical protein
MRALETPLPRSRKPVKKPTPVKLSAMPKARTIAFKAFWLMDSEAQHGSGLTPVQYANAHRLRCAECDAKAERFRALLRLKTGATCFIREVSTRAKRVRI